MIRVWFDAHWHVLAIAGLGVIVIVSALLTGRVRRWWRGLQYARLPGGHKAPARRADPVWDDDPGYDDAFDAALAGEDIPLAECGDPDCSQMTHSGEFLIPLPDGPTMRTWDEPRPVQSVRLPPWERDDQIGARFIAAAALADLPGPGDADPGSSDRAGEPDLPGPQYDPGGRTPHEWRNMRAGKLTRRIRIAWWWLRAVIADALLRFRSRNPIDLPVPAEAPTAAAIAAPSGGGGEPVLEGVVVTSPILTDEWLQDRLAELQAWSDAEHADLYAWSGRLELEAAAA